MLKALASMKTEAMPGKRGKGPGVGAQNVIDKLKEMAKSSSPEEIEQAFQSTSDLINKLHGVLEMVKENRKVDDSVKKDAEEIHKALSKIGY